jgi:hypothetical protein
MGLETEFLLLGWGLLGAILVTALCSSNYPKAQAGTLSKETLRRRIWKKLTALPWWANVLGVVATSLSVVTAIYVIYQADYATVPDIQPDLAISPTWADLPLRVKNQRDLFDISNPSVFCEPEEVLFETFYMAGKFRQYRIKGDMKVPVQNIPSKILSNEAITISCDISEVVKATLDTPTNKIPIHAIRMHVRIIYNTRFWPWERSQTSNAFTWRPVSGGYQWLEGDTSNVFAPHNGATRRESPMVPNASGGVKAVTISKTSL